MPKTASQNALIKERRKNQIMDTALRLFANYGIDNVTIDNISSSMKISHGLFYHYFEDKEDLIRTLVAKAKEMFLSNLESFDADNQTPAVLLRQITNSILNNIKSSDAQAYYVYLVLTLDYHNEQATHDFSIQLKEYLYKLAKKGREEGIFINVDEKDLVTLYLSTLQGICYHRIKYKKSFQVPELDSILALILK